MYYFNRELHEVFTGEFQTKNLPQRPRHDSMVIIAWLRFDIFLLRLKIQG